MTGANSAIRAVCAAVISSGSTLAQSTVSCGLSTRSTRTTFGHVISNRCLSPTGSMAVFGSGGCGTSSRDSCGRNVNGTPKTFTYSGSSRPVSALTS